MLRQIHSNLFLSYIPTFHPAEIVLYAEDMDMTITTKDILIIGVATNLLQDSVVGRLFLRFDENIFFFKFQ